MKKEKKRERYEVSVKVEIHTTLSISADSFEEALELARQYKEKDVVDFDTDFIDGSIEIIGVYK